MQKAGLGVGLKTHFKKSMRDGPRASPLWAWVGFEFLFIFKILKYYNFEMSL